MTTPYRQACTQMASDLEFQAFLDFARQGNVDVLMDTAARLMRSDFDPYHTNQRTLELFLSVHQICGWSGVLELIATVLREKEQRDGIR